MSKKRNELRLFPVVTPFECVAIDFLGSLPKSKDGYCFIVVIKFRYTELTHEIPLKGAQADAVAHMFVDEGCSRRGTERATRLQWI